VFYLLVVGSVLLISPWKNAVRTIPLLTLDHPCRRIQSLAMRRKISMKTDGLKE